MSAPSGISEAAYRPRLEAIKTYLSRHGWVRKPFARPGVLYYEGPRDDHGNLIVQILPDSEEAADYSLRVDDLLASLSFVECRAAADILREIAGDATFVPLRLVNRRAAAVRLFVSPGGSDQPLSPGEAVELAFGMPRAAYAELEIGSDFVALHAPLESSLLPHGSTSLPSPRLSPSVMVREELRRFPELVLSEAGEVVLSELLTAANTVVEQRTLSAEPKAVCLYAGGLAETLTSYLSGDDATRQYVIWRICRNLLSMIDATLELSAADIEKVAQLSNSGEDLGLWLYNLTRHGQPDDWAAAQERDSDRATPHVS